ncbi:hypothetical protein EUX98_g6162 [Antrodiella citrinella]|uniref:Uncharacterized protein n=1 Tax=Antrodiella citrinella TaxID=2447956 RepID=A0A4S4MRV5_9APHY|nr:hypothetical protein EUX98_g6162 [Antrodiella citrinella]
MTDAQSPSRPAWQTDELEDEWIDEEPESPSAHDNSDLSYTNIVGSILVKKDDESPLASPENEAGGTFLIREDVPAAPFLPKTPGKGKKSMVKSFFSPLALETMFEPPSPPLENAAPLPPPTSNAPTRPSRLSQMYIPGDEPSETQSLMGVNGGEKRREDEGGAENVGREDERRSHGLELPQDAAGYQFTFAPPEPNPFDPASTAPNAQSTPIPPTRLGPNAPLTDPRLRLFHLQYDTFTRDHLSAMVDSIAVNTPSDEETVRLPCGVNRKQVDDEKFWSEQAANLMAQIRNDMKGSKRLFSTDTEASHVSHPEFGDKSYVSVGAKHLPPDEDDDATELLPDLVRRPGMGTRDPPVPSHAHARPILSPRRVMRRISATHDVEREMSQSMEQMSLDSSGLLEQFPAPPINVLVTAPQSPTVRFDNMNPSPSHLAPPSAAAPAYPSSSIRSGRNDDLTRFVSSSTASGTTLTAGSAASFVKHAGPKQLRHIAPSDVPTIPDRVGGMVYDKVMMRWVKAPTLDQVGVEDDEEDIATNGGANESEDPFRDIESLREEDSRDQEDSPEPEPSYVPNPEGNDEPFTDDDTQGSILTADLEQSRIEDVDTESEDEEETELNSFSFDSMDAVAATESEYAANAIDLDDSEEEEEEEEEENTITTATSFIQDPELTPSRFEDESQPAPPEPPAWLALAPSSSKLSTPLPQSRSDPTGLSSGIRSAIKSNSITPVSALKDPNKSRFRTPLARLGHRRSVSFSDGKREGPILGVGRNAPTPDVTDGGSADLNLGDVLEKSQSQVVPSARSKRIADMLNDIEDSGHTQSVSTDVSLTPSHLGFEEDSPSKASSGRPPQDELQPLHARRPSSQRAVVGNSTSDTDRMLSRSQSASRVSGRNATFLTECSFGVAHDRLVGVITDVQPFEPHWEQLSSIDLSKRNLDSVARLKEFLPRLDSLSLNSNQLSWLSGVPGSVRTLSVASNILTGVTSFNHLINLENVDVSDNKLDSLRHNNQLGELEVTGTMPRLRILRVSGNRMQTLDVYPFPNLRTLYADNNSLGSINNAQRLSKLENLSLRNQGGRGAGLKLGTHDVRDVKRMYLSELAACRLTSLPGDFARLVPNLRVLNLNYNFLDDTRPLEGLTRVRKLTLIGSRVRTTKLLVRVVRGMPDIEMLDFRMNPCTLGWYLPLLVKDVPGALQPSDVERLHSDDALAARTGTRSANAGTGRDGQKHRHAHAAESHLPQGEASTAGISSTERMPHHAGAEEEDDDDSVSVSHPTAGLATWKDLDSKFRRDLPDDAYVGRLVYRGLVMRACPGIRMLDGVETSEKEREKAEKILKGIIGINREKQRGLGAKEKGKELGE